MESNRIRMKQRYTALVRRAKEYERTWGSHIASRWFALQFHILLNFTSPNEPHV